MLSKERLARYRRMSRSEKWAETEALMTLAWEALLRLSREERERRISIAMGRRPMRRRRGPTRPRRPRR